MAVDVPIVDIHLRGQAANINVLKAVGVPWRIASAQ
jgi:hypothetical protein